eukprot:GHVP01015957.1.p1 GENE.GHVP01015957.1~~GHVP01015957.1.p1  ORF type:complete len:121 (-),score=9.02 GHVP01015957.1:435-797(-)
MTEVLLNRLSKWPRFSEFELPQRGCDFRQPSDHLYARLIDLPSMTKPCLVKGNTLTKFGLDRLHAKSNRVPYRSKGSDLTRAAHNGQVKLLFSELLFFKYCNLKPHSVFLVVYMQPQDNI